VHAYAAVRYVGKNPIRTGIARKAEEYRSSGAGGNGKGFSDDIISTRCCLGDEIRDWKKYLQKEEGSTLIRKIRKCSMNGRPFGDEAFARESEARLNRRLKALSPGRPRRGK
jgi:REP-associated tyrosine transposase